MKLKINVHSVTVFAPATVTNVSCGFDIMGFALNQPGDVIRLTRSQTPGLTISNIEASNNSIPLQIEKNTAGKALLSMYRALKLQQGFEMEIYKQMAVGTGLGSSAASAVAAVYALNQFLEEPLAKNQLLSFAIEGEKLTSGGHIHADNVAACLFGGFVVIRSIEPLEVIPLDYPPELHCAIVHPHLELKTADMRRILREQIPLKDAIQQWGNIAGLVIGLQKGDFELISHSLKDVIIEPIRGKIIPGYEEARRAALQAGALGSGISGSGPSIFALTRSAKQARHCAQAMAQIYQKLDLQYDVYISSINPHGPQVLKVEEAK